MSNDDDKPTPILEMCDMHGIPTRDCDCMPATGPLLPQPFVSRFQIDDKVRANGVPGTIESVTFHRDKIYYEVLTANGTSFNVPSHEVEPYSPPNRSHLQVVRDDQA